MTTEPIIFSPFYEYLEQRRRVILDELAQIEKLIGIYPSTAEIRKAYKQITINENDSIAGVVKNEMK